MIRLGQIQHRDSEEIVELTLSFKQNEFTVNQVNDEVPDNLDAQTHQLHTHDIFHIKKFYIYIENCEVEHLHGQELCDVILEYARQQGATTIFLDMPCDAESSSTFFEKNGWISVTKQDLRIRNRYPDRSSCYYRFDII